jgi:hypothetical protein
MKNHNTYKNTRTTISLLVGFDGASPHISSAVKRLSTHSFLLFPSRRRQAGISEEALGSAGSRLSTRIRNAGSAPVEISIAVDWETDKYLEYRDIGYIRPENETEWTMIPAIRDDTRLVYRFVVAPGVTELGLYPEYNVATCQTFVEAMRARSVAVEVLGRSREKRPLYLLSFPSLNPRAKRFFIQTRDHAYETAGSFVAEGIAEFLLSSDALATYIRSKFHIYILPMTNPDGVYNGMSRLTWEQGADMNRLHTVKDAAHATLKRTIDRIRPDVHMNVHNWQNKFRDGLLCNDPAIQNRILTHFPADAAHGKHWYTQTLYEFLIEGGYVACPPAAKSWKDYVKERFGGTGVTFEFPWFGLSTAEMRKKGKQAFVAYALAVIEIHSL